MIDASDESIASWAREARVAQYKVAITDYVRQLAAADSDRSCENFNSN